MPPLDIDRRTFLGAASAGGAALLLPAGTAAASGALGRMVVEETSGREQAEVPLAFGVAAPRGMLPAGHGVVVPGVAAQLDRLNAWDDGSLRFGVVTALVPRLAAGQRLALDLRAAPEARDGRPGLSPGDILRHMDAAGGAPRFEWRDRDHGLFHADAADGLRAGRAWHPERPHLAGRWLSGPLCTEWVCSVPLRDGAGRRHPSLRAWFHCRAWKGRRGIAAIRVDAVLDNSLGPYDAEVTDVVGDVVLWRGGAPAWSRLGGLPGAALVSSSAEGTKIANADRCAVLRAAGAFSAEDRFKLIEAEGVIAHILDVEGANAAVGRLHWEPRLIVDRAKRPGAGALPLNPHTAADGAIRLNLSRRLRIAAVDGQDLRRRRFVVEGRDAAGRPLRETLTGPEPGAATIGGADFAAVTAVRVDGATAGRVEIGTAPFAGTAPVPPGRWRLWGMALAAWTRWPVRLWYGEPAAVLHHDPAIFLRARLLPNYDGRLVSDRHGRFIAELAANLVWESDSAGRPLPNSRDRTAPARSCLNVVMGGGQTGGRPDLAPIPGQQAAWLLAPGSGGAARAMLAAGLALNQWPWQWRDRATGLAVEPGRHPRFTTHFNARPEDRPPNRPHGFNSICRMGTDSEHWIDFSYLPFLVTGDLIHYEAMVQAALGAWAWFPARWPWRTDNEGYDRALVTASPRNIAWVCRNLGHLRVCGPDRLLDAGVTTPRAVIDRIWGRQQRWLHDWFARGPDPDGFHPAEKGDHKVLMTGRAPTYIYAPWQHAFLSAAFAHLAEAEALDAHGRAFFDWYRSYSVDQVDPRKTNPGAAVMAYYWRGRRADGRPVAGMAEAYRIMAEEEWPEPTSPHFARVEPNAPLTLRGDHRRPGAVVVLEAASRTSRGRAGVFDARFLGRRLATADGGLATLLRLDGGTTLARRATARVERPFAKGRYDAKRWRLQPPAAGPSPFLMLDHTRGLGQWPYVLMGALAALAGAGTPGAAEAWTRLRRMARNSGDDWPGASPGHCGWAIAPR